MASHFPNSLPCRQSFIYIALMLVMCYQAYTGLRETPWETYLPCFLGVVIFILLAEKLVDNPERYHFSVFYVAILFMPCTQGCCTNIKEDGALDAIILTA